MPSITEFVLWKWWSMLDNDTTRLDFLDLNVTPRHHLVHHATTALHPSVHQFTYLQVLYIYVVFTRERILKVARSILPNEAMKPSCCQVTNFHRDILLWFCYRLCICLLWRWTWCSRCHPCSWQLSIWIWQAQVVGGVGKGLYKLMLSQF